MLSHFPNPFSLRLPPLAVNKFDYLVLFVMAVIVIIGIYQFYFWCQRNKIRESLNLECFVDRWFPYYPAWVWIYSGLYYPIIVLMVLTFKDMRHFCYTVFSFFILLLCQMFFFVFLPVETPEEWRNLAKGKQSVSNRFLRFVHSFDAPSNCFPSMHVSVAMLTAMHLTTNIPDAGWWFFLYPLMISISALYTKQHYFLDLIPGALLGWGIFRLFLLMY